MNGFLELAYLRATLGLCQQVMARRLGVRPMTISHWETGARRPSEPVRRLILLLRALPLYEAREILSNMEAEGWDEEMRKDHYRRPRPLSDYWKPQVAMSEFDDDETPESCQSGQEALK
jgi:DNA-binding XRE family transcriptional regulator